MARLYCLIAGIVLLLLGYLGPGPRFFHLAGGAVLVCLGAAGWGVRMAAQTSGLVYTLAALLGFLSALLMGGRIPVVGIQAVGLYDVAYLVIGWMGLWAGFRVQKGRGDAAGRPDTAAVAPGRSPGPDR